MIGYKLIFTIILLSFSVYVNANKNSNCKDIKQMIKQLQYVLKTKYVLPENGLKGANHLEKINTSRWSSVCENEKELAEFLTSEVRQSTGDNHILVEYINQNKKKVEDNWIEKWKENGATVNFGLEAVKIFPGNIGLIKISSFYTYDLMKENLVAAFKLTEHTKALIIDLRNNGGGDTKTEMIITNTFFDDENFEPLVMVNQAGNIVSTKIKVPNDWKRVGQDKPLVILLNKKSFSAPESLAYALQVEGRAVIVGETSGGGANPLGEPIKLTDNFQIWVPQIRPINLKSKTNWEGVGVIPDIKATDLEAEQKARSYLLNALK